MITVRPYDAAMTQVAVVRTPVGGWRGWIGPLLAGIVAALTRLPYLSRPQELVFDEIYYAVDALGLLQFGTEQQNADNIRELLPTDDANWQSLPLFTGEPQFVAHPPGGKWVIAVGEAMFGATTFGWRIAVALLGIASVIILARIVRRLTASNGWGTIAGLLLALDGIHIVMSRTALLDLIVGFWILIAFALLLIDRARARESDRPFGPRPIRWLAALALGCAVATKWSALWYLAAFIMLTVIWDAQLRRDLGEPHPWRTTLLHPVAALGMLAIAAATYLVSWSGWLFTRDGWGRDWAEGLSIVPGWLRSLWHYHAEQWQFHSTLDVEHNYASSPLGWAIQLRPTSFYYEKDCPDGPCAAEILALGNPVIWWVGVLAMVGLIWMALRRPDWRAIAVLTAIAAGWLPWLLFPDRPVFTFYTVIYVPFLIMGIVIVLQRITEVRRQLGIIVTATVITLVVIAAWWFMPIWTGHPLSPDAWRARMWLSSWI